MPPKRSPRPRGSRRARRSAAERAAGARAPAGRATQRTASGRRLLHHFPVRSRRRRRAGGFTLIDLLLAVAVLGLVAVISVPSLSRATRRMRLHSAAVEVHRILVVARSHAVRHSAHVGVKFHPGRGGELTTWTLHLDGDGDGVRSRDVRRGVDPPVPTPGGDVHRVARFAGGLGFGFPPGPLPRDPAGRRLRRRHDPIRFNRSDIASFGPVGTATPGTLYLTDGRHLAAVRVTSRTGRVRVLLYEPEQGEWR